MDYGIAAIVSNTCITSRFAHIPFRQNVFKSDDEASAYVQQRANEGSRYHQGIIAILMRRKFQK